MADLQKPAPAKRALPFKRTARPKPPGDAVPAADDDGLALFSQSKNYFPTVVEDQQRRAREKAKKAEQERNERLAREREEEEAKAREAESRREKRRKEAKEREKESDSAKKRRRNSLLSHEGDDDVFSDQPQTPHKPSSPLSSSSRRDDSVPRNSREPETARKPRVSTPEEAPVVLLDSSDDEDPTRRGSNIIGTSSGRHSIKGKGKAVADEGDSDIEMWEEKKENEEEAEGGEGEDPSEFYIKAAMERMRKAKEARLARESSAASNGKNELPNPSVNDDAPVSVMIAAPALSDAKVLCCTVRTTQALQIAFDTFKERQKSQTKYPHKLISELVFTWRGDRVYYTTKLETLGIRPRGVDGRLHDNTHSGRNGPEGYVGKDKVYFEAWSPEDYEKHQQEQERDRKRREMGEWWDEDDTANGQGNNDGQAADAEASQKEEDRVKVIFKARDMPPRNVTLRKYSTVAHMIKAFRKLAGIGEDKHIEIRWDGETLDLETTVEEADIGDMDSVEVHIR
ncbi:hypothetical protein F5B22DRAFT_625170 [Xylaria bambusicola]|uniref:uncharacterized protein n=1 Tax=Xylaria bambusicola TaxID=326684 RepID=UPI002007FA89|nr:uncharacterized protein F5B22DRAFT_625170 [Xylaria bambusicola]KAI0506096.1 hypothetical protein F5B22DRAFT_625170 [Xylaria bambusicola]